MYLKIQTNTSKKHKLIDLADDVLRAFVGKPRLFQYTNPHDNPLFSEIAKLERKFKLSGLAGTSDALLYLDQFSIPLKAIPKRLYNLMIIIAWLDENTHVPMPYLAGFYSVAFYDYDKKKIKAKHYCTVERYIHLLFIDLELSEAYLPDESTDEILSWSIPEQVFEFH